jgi:hypothetical protein
LDVNLSPETPDKDEPTSYFGVYSAKQRDEIIVLLRSLVIRFEFVAVAESEERLRAWTAWDESSAATLEGFELFISSADLSKVGTKLVDLYPRGSK